MRPVSPACRLILSTFILTAAAPNLATAQAPTTTAAERRAQFEALGDLDLSAVLEIDIKVVSATKLATSLNEVPSIVTVVTQRDMRRWGYRSVAEVLERTLGFYVVDDHITPNVAVRGVAGAACESRKFDHQGHDRRPPGVVSSRRPATGWGLNSSRSGPSTRSRSSAAPPPRCTAQTPSWGSSTSSPSAATNAAGVDLSANGNFVNENFGGRIRPCHGSAVRQVRDLRRGPLHPRRPSGPDFAVELAGTQPSPPPPTGSKRRTSASRPRPLI